MPNLCIICRLPSPTRCCGVCAAEQSVPTRAEAAAYAARLLPGVPTTLEQMPNGRWVWYRTPALPHLPGCPCTECQPRTVRCFAVGVYLGNRSWARFKGGCRELLPYRALPKYL